MPKVFAKILCPIEFDATSAATIKYACEVAECDGGGMLYLLHVVSPPRIDRILAQPHPVLTEQIATKELEKLAREHVTTGVSHRTAVRTGDPATSIVATAEEFDVNLIVMATHGYQGIARTLLGSVAERVIREAKRHVLVVRPSLLKAW